MLSLSLHVIKVGLLFHCFGYHFLTGAFEYFIVYLLNPTGCNVFLYDFFEEIKSRSCSCLLLTMDFNPKKV